MRARFVQGVTPAEQEALVGTVRNSGDATLVRRCQAIVLSAAGQTVPAIARLMGVDASTIHRWLGRFETGGIGALGRGVRAAPGGDSAPRSALVWSGALDLDLCLLAGYLAMVSISVTISPSRVTRTSPIIDQFKADLIAQ